MNDIINSDGIIKKLGMWENIDKWGFLGNSKKMLNEWQFCK